MSEDGTGAGTVALLVAGAGLGGFVLGALLADARASAAWADRAALERVQGTRIGYTIAVGEALRAVRDPREERRIMAALAEGFESVHRSTRRALDAGDIARGVRQRMRGLG